MQHNIKSIRTFIGAEDYATSRDFYLQLGFEEIVTSPKMSYFKKGAFGFYLQDYYVKDWIENSMVFLEVEALESYYKQIQSLHLEAQYPKVKLSTIQHNDWGKEFFLHDPSGVLWHIGLFFKGPQ